MFRKIIFFLLATLLFGCPIKPPVESTNLFLDETPPTLVAKKNSISEYATNSRIAKLNKQYFFKSSDMAKTAKVNFNLLGNIDFEADQLNINESTHGGYIWSGKTEAPYILDLRLSIQDEVIYGSILTSKGPLEITHISDDWYRISLFDEANFPRESAPVITTNPQKNGFEWPTSPECDNPPFIAPPPGKGHRISIMMVYTAKAAKKYNIYSYIDIAIDSLSKAWNNQPNFIVYPVLAHSVQTTTAEAIIEDDLHDLRNPSDGRFDEIHALRDTYRADLVVLLADYNGDCGIGNMPLIPDRENSEYGFSIVDVDCGNSNYTVAHEIGHNLSMDHDRYITTSTTPFAYGFSNKAKKIRSIMAYPDECDAANIDCPRTLSYSYPQDLGVPIGSPQAAHNREMLCTAAYHVSKYRQ